jgi:hypothetical protein
MLRPLRQEDQINVDFVCPFTQEAGGILTFAVASGIDIVQYAFDPSGKVAAGIQINDIENVDFSREIYPQRLRTTSIPLEVVGVGMQGEFDTDFIHIVGTVSTGDPVYVGPSGLFTNSPSFGGAKVGRFRSTLTPNPHVVTIRGQGFSRQLVDTVTKQIIFNNNPADRVLVLSDGNIKLRIFNLGRPDSNPP